MARHFALKGHNPNKPIYNLKNLNEQFVKRIACEFL